MATPRVGLLGGTFDPIHNAHLTIAQEALAQFQLDRVLFVPAAHPPHKPSPQGASYEDRFRMVDLACGDDPQLLASRLEEGADKSYSIQTIEKLRAAGNDVWFIIGADAFAEVETWHRWPDVAAATEFIVVTRPGHDYKVPEGAKVHRLDTVALPVSSSEIRQSLAENEIPKELPMIVAVYIVEKKLYGYGGSDPAAGLV